MARVIYSVPVTELIGSIAGTTYQSNRSGYIARSKSFNKRKRINAQFDQMNSFVSYSQAYRDLSGANKLLWDAFAVANSHTTLWGSVRVLDGLRWYILINTYGSRIMAPFATVPPVYSAPVNCAPFTLSIGNLFLQCNTATTFGPAGSSMLVMFTTPFNSPSIHPRRLFLRSGSNISAFVGSFDNVADWVTKTGLNVVDDLVTPGNLIQIGISIVDPTCPIPAPLVFNS